MKDERHHPADQQAKPAAKPQKASEPPKRNQRSINQLLQKGKMQTWHKGQKLRIQTSKNVHQITETV